MDLELVTIGTELLLGLTVDTNGAERTRSVVGTEGETMRMEGKYKPGTRRNQGRCCP